MIQFKLLMIQKIKNKRKTYLKNLKIEKTEIQQPILDNQNPLQYKSIVKIYLESEKAFLKKIFIVKKRNENFFIILFTFYFMKKI